MATTRLRIGLGRRLLGENVEADPINRVIQIETGSYVTSKGPAACPIVLITPASKRAWSTSYL